MQKTIKTCDISNREHTGEVVTNAFDVIFDHDQEDGKTKTDPYFDRKNLEICEGCKKYLFAERKCIYGYGAMGHNTYSL